MFRCIEIIFRDSFLISVEVTKLQNFVTSAIIRKDSLNYVNPWKHFGVLYKIDIKVSLDRPRWP